MRLGSLKEWGQTPSKTMVGRALGRASVRIRHCHRQLEEERQAERLTKILFAFTGLCVAASLLLAAIVLNRTGYFVRF